MVTDHEPQRSGADLAAGDQGVATDEAVAQPGDVDDASALEHDGVLHLAVADLAPAGDGRERPDVAVDDLRPGPDGHGAAHRRAHDLGPRLHDDAPLDARRRVDAAVHA